MPTAIFAPWFIMDFPAGLSHILRAVLAKDSSAGSASLGGRRQPCRGGSWSATGRGFVETEETGPRPSGSHWFQWLSGLLSKRGDPGFLDGDGDQDSGGHQSDGVRGFHDGWHLKTFSAIAPFYFSALSHRPSLPANHPTGFHQVDVDSASASMMRGGSCWLRRVLFLLV